MLSCHVETCREMWSFVEVADGGGRGGEGTLQFAVAGTEAHNCRCRCRFLHSEGAGVELRSAGAAVQSCTLQVHLSIMKCCTQQGSGSAGQRRVIPSVTFHGWVCPQCLHTAPPPTPNSKLQ